MAHFRPWTRTGQLLSLWFCLSSGSAVRDWERHGGHGDAQEAPWAPGAHAASCAAWVNAVRAPECG